MFGFARPTRPTSQPALTPASPTHPPVACFHCGLPVPPSVTESVDFAGRPRPMCCAACAAAANFLIDSGMAANYYRDRPEPVA